MKIQPINPKVEQTFRHLLGELGDEEQAWLETHRHLLAARDEDPDPDPAPALAIFPLAA